MDQQMARAWKRAEQLARQFMRTLSLIIVRNSRAWRALGCALLALAVLLWLSEPFVTVRAAPLGMPADASCATLASADRTATNSGQWGVTLLRGLGKPGGWFGVDVCGNGINQVSPGGSNLSCDRLPANLNKTGCAPGRATYDGFGISFQCVELVTRFAAWAFGDAPWSWHGNAPDLWSAGNHPADFTGIANGSVQKPMPGDVLVWGATDAHGSPWPAGPQGWHDGHVAVVAAVRGDHITIAEQNALWDQKNVPTENKTLIERDGRWYVGDSQHHASAGRALYGWLHSRKNIGVFNGSGAVRGTSVSLSPSQASRVPAPNGDTSAGVPSLAAGVVVTSGGTLADLEWAPSANGATSDPHAAARSLGAPPGTWLAPNQTPAVRVSASGERDVYVIGADGAMYEARTVAQQIGVDWRTLGAPSGARLISSVALASIPNALMLGAVGTDGQLWWRAGTSDNLGGWASAGRPTETTLQGTPVLAGMPGSGVPMAVALGSDGKLYASSWGDTGQTAGFGAWLQVIFPASAGALQAPIVPLFELPTQHAAVGTWQDVAVDLVVRDSLGQLWWLRRASNQPVWAPQAQSLTTPVTRLLGGAVVLPPAASKANSGTTLVHLYTLGARGLDMARVWLDARGRPGQATWTAIQPANPNPASSGTADSAASGSLGAVIPLGADMSVLAEPAGRQVLLAADPKALGTVASDDKTPNADASATPPASTATAGSSWMAGVVASPSSFDDALSGSYLDPRWTLLAGPNGATAMGTFATADGLRLAPSLAPERTLLAQAAPAIGLTTVRVVLHASAPAGTLAGLRFAFDAGDYLDLAVDGGNRVSFCVVSGSQSAPCASLALAPHAVQSGVLLRILNTGMQVTAQVSTDAFSWQTVGTWSVPGSTNAAPAEPSAVASVTATTGRAPAGTVGGWTHFTFTTLALFATMVPASGASGQPSAGNQAAESPNEDVPNKDVGTWPEFVSFTVSA